MRIKLPEGFNVEWMLNHIRSSSYGLPYHFVSQRVLRRPLRFADTDIIAEFDLSQSCAMEVRLCYCRSRLTQSAKKKSGLFKELRKQSEFIWGLNDAVQDYHVPMASDSHLASLFKKFGTLRIIRTPDMYEALLVAVLGQQISVHAAQAVRRRLMQKIGTRLTVTATSGKEHYYFYPAPQQLIKAGESALREQGISRQKASYLLQIAKFGVEGELDRSVFATLSDEDALKRLCKIKGVGRWTAEVALMRGLGRPDIFPAGDMGLQVAVQELWGMPERPSEKVLRKIAERWAGWRSYAAFYLWMTLQSRAL